MKIAAIFLLFLCLQKSCGKVMNSGGVAYQISNPPGSTENWQGTPGQYSTDFENNIDGKVEHFDVYGEVQTLYSQVYWTRNNPIDLPPEIVQRFKGKTMAITGYEVDQVTHSGPQIGSTSTSQTLGGFSCYPDCGENDKSVPIYNAYNHHYFSWLVGSDADLVEADVFLPNPTNTGFQTSFVSVTPNELSQFCLSYSYESSQFQNGIKYHQIRQNTTHGYPTNIVFKENPGGEFRKSYHGYPNGYAQLIHSPSKWVVEPMQIDTHNRNYSINDQVGYKPAFLPKILMNNMTNLHNGLSPLIECPCTDRIYKTKSLSSSILTQGSCQSFISTKEDCRKSIEATGAQIARFLNINNPNYPKGCTIYPENSNVDLVYTGIFNEAASNETCGNNTKVALQGKATIGSIDIKLEHDTKSVTLTLSGPSQVWFGIGFSASQMSDKPYSIIIDGHGQVTERKLDNHSPGSLLKSMINVTSNTVNDDVRKVVIETLVKNENYEFPSHPGDLNLITAIGSGPDFAYHKDRNGGSLTLLPMFNSACLCQPETQNFISYMNESKQGFTEYTCLDQPRSDMGNFANDQANPACHMDSYHGGLQCCKHSWLLTDQDQDSLIDKDQVDTYFLKWRYYFQEYDPSHHKHLHHWVFLIDAQVNDYEEDNENYGQASIGKITAHLKAKDIGLEDLSNPTDDGAPPVPKNFTKITPLVMTPHCHAPSCIRQEFWNEDTGEIICNMTAQYGHGNEAFDEKDYIAILPCIFGHQPGLQFPFDLEPETNVKAVKYFNNTFRHLGQMAQWTGLMVYDTDPY